MSTNQDARKPLSDIQRHALHLASRKSSIEARAGGAEIVTPGKPIARDQVAWATAQALTDHGYTTIADKRLHITPVGAHALKQAQPHQTRFLARHGSAATYETLPNGRQRYVERPDDRDTDRGYTTSPHGSVSNEPEPVDDMELHRQRKAADERAAALKADDYVTARRELASAIERLEHLNLGSSGQRELRHMWARLRALDRAQRDAA